MPIDDSTSRNEIRVRHCIHLPVEAQNIILAVYKHLKVIDKEKALIKKHYQGIIHTIS